MALTFNEILEKHQRFAFLERGEGERFEQLIRNYLLTDPKFCNRFKEVWLWSEFQNKICVGDATTVIDLVALTHEGDYWAINCKCYREDSVIDKEAVDSFLSASNKEFKSEKFKAITFSHRLWISTTNRWDNTAKEALKNQNPPATRLNLVDLENAPVEWGKLDKGIVEHESRRPKSVVFWYQQEGLDKVHEYFRSASRGKLIMGSGMGKTLMSIRFAENETKDKGLILFLAPSLASMWKSICQWSSESKRPFNSVLLCADPEISIAKTVSNANDNFSIIDLALPSSTDAKKIRSQFQQNKLNTNSGLTVVFSTYLHLEDIAHVQKELLKNGFDEFDLIICDDAQHTTGIPLTAREESAFTKIHNTDFIRGKKRLYMTSTPLLYKDDVKTCAKQTDAVFYSMEDSKLFGEEICRIGFGEPTENNLHPNCAS